MLSTVDEQELLTITYSVERQNETVHRSILIPLSADANDIVSVTMTREYLNDLLNIINKGDINEH